MENKRTNETSIYETFGLIMLVIAIVCAMKYIYGRATGGLTRPFIWLGLFAALSSALLYMRLFLLRRNLHTTFFRFGSIMRIIANISVIGLACFACMYELFVWIHPSVERTTAFFTREFQDQYGYVLFITLILPCVMICFATESMNVKELSFLLKKAGLQTAADKDIHLISAGKNKVGSWCMYETMSEAEMNYRMASYEIDSFVGKKRIVDTYFSRIYEKDRLPEEDRKYLSKKSILSVRQEQVPIKMTEVENEDSYKVAIQIGRLLLRMDTDSTNKCKAKKFVQKTRIRLCSLSAMLF